MQRIGNCPVCNSDDLRVLKEHVFSFPGEDVQVYDPCFLEFEFRCPPESDVYTPVVNFDYVFGSEEYYEYVGSPYNDAFGFFLNSQNIALVPGTTDTAVAINNVNDMTNSEYFVGNELINGVPMTNPYPKIEADGFTKELNAAGYPKEGWNKIKIVIGDVSGEKVIISCMNL